MFYVNERWLGGLLTNFTTIQRSLGAAARPRGDGHRRPLRLAVEEGNRQAREGEAQAAEEPRRHPPHGVAARRALRRRHQARADRRRRGAQAEDSGHRRRRHQLRSRPGRLRDPRQRRRAARDPAVHVARSPTRSSKAAACASRRRPTRAPSGGDAHGRGAAPRCAAAAPRWPASVASRRPQPASTPASV